jgi:hypothetical protein
MEILDNSNGDGSGIITVVTTDNEPGDQYTSSERYVNDSSARYSDSKAVVTGVHNRPSIPKM